MPPNSECWQTNHIGPRRKVCAAASMTESSLSRNFLQFPVSRLYKRLSQARLASNP